MSEVVESAARAEIVDILYTRDIAAFVAADWDRVAGDFDSDNFAGYSGAAGGAWSLSYPTLEQYRDTWLEQAALLKGADTLAEDMADAQTIAEITLADGRALVRKEFDGTVRTPDGEIQLGWTTYYFLRRDTISGRWLITGFVGYLPNGRSEAMLP